ncbi:ACT domain-containing protein [Actibacterium sp. 188UL27-1]|uniref:ACT domain-containing protein n=1 Tax=Actibacterium sp. 188UL27-1 TaxID=2786961 RepID=UPI00195CA2C8|nr:ACT domain-containing protein [Actibacterium sp. 188UL27-1]MBM7068946.1 ACT domain-containing protein [Actibacterium sp. 188UL27-1]
MTVVVDLELLAETYAVTRLDPSGPLPDWIHGPGLINVTQAADETSILCQADRVPDGVETSPDWVAIKVSTKFEFDEAGVVLSVVRPLSENGLGLFVISTFYRDYLLIQGKDLTAARNHLAKAGHRFVGDQAD